MKITAFWEVKPCSLVEVYQCFRAISVSAFQISVRLNSCEVHHRPHNSSSKSLRDLTVTEVAEEVKLVCNRHAQIFPNV